MFWLIAFRVGAWITIVAQGSIYWLGDDAARKPTAFIVGTIAWLILLGVEAILEQRRR
jgi:hypothetical protein